MKQLDALKKSAGNNAELLTQIDGFKTSHIRKYRQGLAVCHNGDVYIYKAGNIRVTDALT